MYKHALNCLPRDKAVRIAVWLVVLSALFAMSGDLIDAGRAWNKQPPPTWAETYREADGHLAPHDIDAWNIHRGLVRAPSFIQTLRWWYGPWVLGTAFYRPLSSLVFWIDWKIFGEREVRWIWSALLMHLLAVWQFALLTAAAARHFKCRNAALSVLLAGLIFVYGLYIFPLRPATCGEVVTYWKNQPDSLCTLLFCLAIRQYLMAMPAKKTRDTSSLSAGSASEPALEQSVRAAAASVKLDVGSPVRSVLPAFALFLLASVAKEPGLIVVPLLLCLELPDLCGRARSARLNSLQRLAPFLLVLPFLLLWRTHCVGNTVALRLLHPKPSWTGNILMNAFGPLLAEASLEQWTNIRAGMLLAALFLFARSRWRKSGLPMDGRHILAWTAAAVLLVVLAGLPAAGDGTLLSRLAVSAILSFNFDQLPAIAALAMFLLGVLQAVRTSPVLAAFGLVWVELTLVSTLPLQTLAYHYYLMDGGFALIIGIGIAQYFPLRTGNSSPGPTSESLGPGARPEPSAQ